MRFSSQSLVLSRRRRNGGGFTLIELLVSAGITAVIAGFIVAIVSNVSGFWTRTSGKLSTEAQARLVLDQLTLDLSSAVYRDDGNVWMAADVLNGGTGGASGLWQPAAANPKPVGGLSLAMNAADWKDARFGTAGIWLRFFTTKRGNNATADATSLSAPVAVGYQVIRRLSSPSTVPANAAKAGYLLHRAEARAATANGRPGVLESGYDLDPTPAIPTNYSRSNLNGVRNDGATTGDPRSIQVPGSRTNLASVIADNVIDFGVRCYVRDPTQSSGLRLVFPATNANGTASNVATARLRALLPANTPVDSTNYNFVFPDVVDVMVRILTDEGAKRIALYETANTPLSPPAGVNAQQYWWQLATANSQVFTRRIVLNAKPL